MGTFFVTIDVADLAGTRFEPMEALVDTGATYLCVPGPVLESLGVEPASRRRFELGDGRVVEYPVSDVSLRLQGETHPVLCVFGDSASGPVLGAVPLETFGLAADPVHRRLIPVTALLISTREKLED